MAVLADAVRIDVELGVRPDGSPALTDPLPPGMPECIYPLPMTFDPEKDRGDGIKIIVGHAVVYKDKAAQFTGVLSQLGIIFDPTQYPVEG